jgi:hypothetical protein
MSSLISLPLGIGIVISLVVLAILLLNRPRPRRLDQICVVLKEKTASSSSKVIIFVSVPIGHEFDLARKAKEFECLGYCLASEPEIAGIANPYKYVYGADENGRYSLLRPGGSLETPEAAVCAITRKPTDVTAD